MAYGYLKRQRWQSGRGHRPHRKRGLDQVVAASKRMNRYEAELEGLPHPAKIAKDAKALIVLTAGGKHTPSAASAPREMQPTSPVSFASQPQRPNIASKPSLLCSGDLGGHLQGPNRSAVGPANRAHSACWIGTFCSTPGELCYLLAPLDHRSCCST
jgi:hypothetical protein